MKPDHICWRVSLLAVKYPNWDVNIRNLKLSAIMTLTRQVGGEGGLKFISQVEMGEGEWSAGL